MQDADKTKAFSHDDEAKALVDTEAGALGDALGILDMAAKFHLNWHSYTDVEA